MQRNLSGKNCTARMTEDRLCLLLFDESCILIVLANAIVLTATKKVFCVVGTHYLNDMLPESFSVLLQRNAETTLHTASSYTSLRPRQRDVVNGNFGKSITRICINNDT